MTGLLMFVFAIVPCIVFMIATTRLLRTYLGWDDLCLAFGTRHSNLWIEHRRQRVSGFATNSRYIAQRVRTHYGLESEIVYAPVQTKYGYIDPNIEDYYLCVGRLVDSKRVDILIDACNRLGRRLIVVGRGRELARP